MADVFRLEGGIAGVAGGLFLLAGHLLNLGGDPATGTTLGKGFVLAGHAVLVFAFVGLYARQRADGPAPVGRAGMVLGVLGTVLVTAVVFVELAGTTGVDTTPVFAAAGTTALYTVGPLVFVLGMVLVGASVLRGGALPRWSGALLVAGTVVFAAASAVPGLAGPVTVLGATLTAGGFGWAGAGLLAASRSRTPTAILGEDE